MKKTFLAALPARGRLVILIAAVTLLIIPMFVSSNYIISTLVTCFIFACFGIAWNIIGGYGAQISWCHSAFAAIGGYTSFMSAIYFHIPPMISVFAGMLLSLFFSTVIGYGTFRLRGPFFSIATIAFAEIVRTLLLYFKNQTGGAAGLYITYRGEDPINLTFSNNVPFYYIMLVVLAAVLIVTWRFEISKTGYYLKAIKGDEDAAASLGIKTFRVKLTAFQVSAMITSAIGCIYGHFMTFLEPTMMCGLNLSVKIGVVAIIGGIGTLWGPVIGAFAIIPLIELTNVLFSDLGGASQMLYGLLLIIIVIFRPQGIISLFVKPKEKAAPNLFQLLMARRAKK